MTLAISEYQYIDIDHQISFSKTQTLKPKLTHDYSTEDELAKSVKT